MAPLLRAMTLIFIASLACLAAAQEPVHTGPETEFRFPPIKVPSQFKATLFACDPLIEYPSVLALGLTRLRARKSSTLIAETGESSLHLSPTKSGHEPHILSTGKGT